ncbi:hypothetical protein MLD38_004933 [Melastoma candidum]|uniref:Uncharacterized protein n=1 Tax=Melastoma candidum TaxID=119954 RepID=A0ACB9S769_9MYRT|nr:hypothetical protein MLD38_004933 [Melastoma candidum]
MNPYANDLSLYDFSLSDSILESSPSFSHRFGYDSPPCPRLPYSPSGSESPQPPPAPPPSYRHDGRSPLPLGMDWSHPPRLWEGPKTKWPHDPHTGWSYCVTIPSWILLPKSRGSDPIVFYRVQVGVQSPEGITSTRGVLRRFSEFQRLIKELKNEFPAKKLPPMPPRRLLGTKSDTQLEERRCSLEDWMERLLSDIELSRTAIVANFLELEAAARLFFNEMSLSITKTNATLSQTVLLLPEQTTSEVSTSMLSPSVMSDHGKDSIHEISGSRSPRIGPQANEEAEVSASGLETAVYDLHHQGLTSLDSESFDRELLSDKLERFLRGKRNEGQTGVMSNNGDHYDDVSDDREQNEREPFDERGGSKLDGQVIHGRRFSAESFGSDFSYARASDMAPLSSMDDISRHLDGSDAGRIMEYSAISELQFPKDLAIALMSEERHKMRRILTTMRQRLATAKTDMEDLIVRFNQEAAVRQFLTTKVKDLEAELETTRHSCKENARQSTFIEKEKFTKMQWDLEELRRKCLETEVQFKSEQDERARTELARMSLLQERDMMLIELDGAREQIDSLQKHNEELEAKSKAEIKVLVKEVKSLRSSQVEWKHQLSQLLREKIALERALEKEKQKAEDTSATNGKLLRECKILRDRLEECSVNFLVEEEDELIVDTSSPSDAIDLLTTSDNRIGLLLAEAQLLAEDVENAAKSQTPNANEGTNGRTSDDEIRKMLTDIFIDNATLRKQVNTVIRCALNIYLKNEKEEDGDDEVPLRKTVLSKFLER